MSHKASSKTKNDSTATIGFEAKLWLAAAGKCRMANAEIRTRNVRSLRHSKFIIRNFPWSHL
jgi:hypothetical protein